MSALTARDREQLRIWLRSGATLAELENQRYGLVGNERWSANAERAYRLLWSWCAPRFSGRAGLRQQRAYDRLGRDAYLRRIERANRIADRLSRAAT